MSSKIHRVSYTSLSERASRLQIRYFLDNMCGPQNQWPRIRKHFCLLQSIDSLLVTCSPVSGIIYQNPSANIFQISKLPARSDRALSFDMQKPCTKQACYWLAESKQTLLLASRVCLPSANQQQACLVQSVYMSKGLVCVILLGPKRRASLEHVASPDPLSQ